MKRGDIPQLPSENIPFGWIRLPPGEKVIPGDKVWGHLDYKWQELSSLPTEVFAHPPSYVIRLAGDLPEDELSRLILANIESDIPLGFKKVQAGDLIMTGDLIYSVRTFKFVSADHLAGFEVSDHFEDKIVRREKRVVSQIQAPKPNYGLW